MSRTWRAPRSGTTPTSRGTRRGWTASLAGFSAYEIDGPRIIFTHTEVEDAYEGQGVGGALARAALDDVRERGGLRVVPRCPFIKSWMDEHPDYLDLRR